LFVPVAHQRDKEGDTTGQKDNAAAEAQHIIVRQALRDEEDGADKEQQPACQVITFLFFTDGNIPLSDRYILVSL
jgi:hypothetical protein